MKKPIISGLNLEIWQACIESLSLNISKCTIKINLVLPVYGCSGLRQEIQDEWSSDFCKY